MKECICKNFPNVLVEPEYNFWDASFNERSCPNCGKTLFVKIPNHIPFTQHHAYIGIVLKGISNETH